MRSALFLTLVVLGCTEPLAPSQIPPKRPASGAAGQTEVAGSAGSSGASGSGDRDESKSSQKPEVDEPSGDRDAMDAGADDDGEADGDDPQEPPPEMVNDAGRDAAAPAADAGTPLDPVGGLVGIWSGDVEDLFDRITPTCVTITQVGVPGAAGDAIYRDTVNCRISLTYLESEGTVHSFNEMQIAGTGCPGGVLKLALNADDTLDYAWYVNGGGIPESQATLARVDECPWQPRF